MTRIFHPHTVRNKIVTQKGSVRGNGVSGVGILLDGGQGHSNSYSDIQTYRDTVTAPQGEGLGKSFLKKLDNLNIRPIAKKYKNIQFRM
jgi:hypothetical protein